MITMVTGGQRSGKSVFAESMALKRSGHPVYVATARVWDEEFRHRVELHRQRRADRWTTMEEPLHVGELSIPDGSVVLVDCMTLLATNWFFELGESVDAARDRVVSELESLFSRNADFIVVTNEIGLGGVSSNTMQRRFADLQGWLNQSLAARADEVYLVVSGIPVEIKRKDK